jgi:hypothetical protein
VTEYHKIQTIFKRDMDGDRRLVEGAWTLPEFEYLAPLDWQWTEKVDGTNVRVVWDGSKVLFHGRTDNAQMPVILSRRLGDIFLPGNSDHLMREQFGDGDVVLYGEGYGARIQKVGGLYLPDRVDFVLFDVNVSGWWLDRDGIAGVAAHFGIQPVPLVGVGSLSSAIEYVKSGPVSTWGHFPMEGVVMRPAVELHTRKGQRVIAKLKHRDFAAQ